MPSKSIIAVAVAGALALPLSVLAATGSPSATTRGGTPGATDNAANTSEADIANTPGKPGSNSPSARASGSVHLSAKEFDKLDKNHDGSLSKDEVRLHPVLRSKFSSLDKDHDGKLSQAEISAGTNVGSADSSTRSSRSGRSSDRVASNVNPDRTTRGGTASGGANTADVSRADITNTPGTPGTSSPSAGR